MPPASSVPGWFTAICGYAVGPALSVQRTGHGQVLRPPPTEFGAVRLTKPTQDTPPVASTNSRKSKGPPSLVRGWTRSRDAPVGRSGSRLSFVSRDSISIARSPTPRCTSCMKTMSALSRASRIASTASDDTVRLLRSKSTTVDRPRPAAAASWGWVQSRRALAARDCGFERIDAARVPRQIHVVTFNGCPIARTS